MFATRTSFAFVIIVTSVLLGSSTAIADPEECREGSYLEFASPAEGDTYRQERPIELELIGAMVNTNCVGPREHYVLVRLYSGEDIIWENHYFVGPGDCWEPEPFEINDVLPGLPVGDYVLEAGISDNFHTAPYCTTERGVRVVRGWVIRPVQVR